MSTNKKIKRDYLQTEVDLTTEMEVLLAKFTPEEIETGVVRTGRPQVSGSHTIGDLIEAYEGAVLEDSIGELLRAARERREHSLRDAGDALGVTRARAHQLEQPGANLRIASLQRYAQAYGYTVQVAFLPKNRDEPPIIAELPD